MTPRLVVFDLDGTLVDSCGDLTTAVNAALAWAAPGAAPLPAALVRTFIGSGATLLMTRALAHRGIDRPAAEVLPAFLDAYRACLLETTRPYPGTVEVLDALAGRQLAVLTNKPGDMSRALLEGLGLAPRFARIVGAGDGPGRKPDPAGLLALLAALGVAPAEAVLVGDSGIDVETGRAAGVRTLGAAWGFDTPGLLEARPDLLLQDIRELPRALGRAGAAPPVIP